jgi:hypothetical protein
VKTVGKIADWYSSYRTQYGSFLSNLNYRTTVRPNKKASEARWQNRSVLCATLNEKGREMKDRLHSKDRKCTGNHKRDILIVKSHRECKGKTEKSENQPPAPTLAPWGGQKAEATLTGQARKPW